MDKMGCQVYKKELTRSRVACEIDRTKIDINHLIEIDKG